MEAVARPYAAAAFAVAREQENIDGWRETLAAMAQAAAAVSQLTQDGGLLLSSARAAEAVAEAVAGSVSDSQKRFLAVLAENDRVPALPKISELFDALHRDHLGVVRVRVETAHDIDERNAFDRLLSRRFGQAVEVDYLINAELLGGVCIYVNDDVLDASVRGRLHRLAASLA